MVTTLVAVLQPAFADFQYTLTGEDVYRVESTATVSRVSYSGTERLSVTRSGKSRRFEVLARYARNGTGGRSSGGARFVAELLPNGAFEDRLDDDPDFLTILNQPFAVELDRATLRDLRELHGAIPFAASSPLGGSGVLHGFLRPGISGPVGRRPTVAVRFEAAGPMTGTLPGHAQASVSGSLQMDGTAYYSLGDAMLLALDATLRIDARLHESRPSISLPVHITYRRSIRAAIGNRPVEQAVRRRR